MHELKRNKQHGSFSPVLFAGELTKPEVSGKCQKSHSVLFAIFGDGTNSQDMVHNRKRSSTKHKKTLARVKKK